MGVRWRSGGTGQGAGLRASVAVNHVEMERAMMGERRYDRWLLKRKSER